MRVCFLQVRCSVAARESRSGEKGSLEDDVNLSPWIALVAAEGREGERQSHVYVSSMASFSLNMPSYTATEKYTLA